MSTTTATPGDTIPVAPDVGGTRTDIEPERPSWGPLVVLLAGVFITTLDFFIVNVAIPATQSDLGASAAAIQWVVAGYGLALAALLITAGRLGDILGRRRMYMVGMALFTVSSAACGLAGNPEALIAARVVQGASAALLMPQVLGIVNIVYTGATRARAFVAYSLTIGLAGVFGQLIGGGLIEIDLFGMDWRSIYWINVPVGVAALLLTRRLVPESRGSGGTRLDVGGVVLVTAAMVAVVLPLVQGREQGWPLWTWLSLAAGPVLLGGFVAHQHRLRRRSGAPLVDLAMFRERSFSAGLGVVLAYQLTTASFFLVLALYLQMGHGMSALDSGLLFVTLGAGYFAGATQATRITARLGRQTIALGALLTAVGYGILAATVAATGVTGSVGLLVPGLVVSGLGMGVALAPMSAVVLAGVTARYAAAASGVLNTAQQVGNALGVALIGIVFYGALDSGASPNDYAHAFTWALIPLVACCTGTALLVQRLPRPAEAPETADV
ncbi:MFS transporter [Yinghuangia sp. ASG 101]|uniref:MFS transporter n=1 Tax=Yinghuangia sp. ASG 101 TaxID=2896848 RepID=UPI001E5AF193|nr:MFS transporter [Yinghuangia sp. ASG 101]UGQ13621.1 MFS transporter [Yinghuangia sp. ASG 101]